MNQSDSNPQPGKPAHPAVRKTRRWNIVWVMPILALLIGAWLLYNHFSTSGPVITISFETAEGIHAGQTEVRCRSVRVGVVRKLKLSDDLNSVILVAEIDEDAGRLLRENTKFWVVKPRFSAAEISGLGTIIQGAYIELDPGSADGKRSSSFVGLETPPATSSSVPGRRIVLNTNHGGSLQIGAPIYYRGFEVGRIESRQLSDDGMVISHKAFISDDYSHLITENCRFWNSSGLELNASATGVVVRTPSLQSMISGGISFGLIDGAMGPGESVDDGAVFTLFNDQQAARRSTFTPTLEFLLLFDQSVRGLTTDSPVEFRGIPIGRISRISSDLITDHDDPRVPVLIDIDPSLCRPKGEDVTMRPDATFFLEEAKKGLRASLKTTNLITGAVHIEFDYDPGAETAEIGKVGDYATFPTTTGGLAQLEPKINQIIDKLRAVPLEEAMNAITEATAEGLDMATAARKVIEGENFQTLPKDIRDTLAELRSALASLKAVADLLESKPNAIIFGRGRDKDDQEEDRPTKIGPRHR